jgi:hypothetical protein
MWWMGKGSINRERCTTPEELSIQAQATLAIITMDSVNGMTGSSSTCLCAILALKGQCLNGHPNVMRDLRRDRQTAEGIADAGEAHAETLQRFVERSRALSAALSTGDQPRNCRKWIAQSVSLIRMLPSDTQEHTGMTPAQWERTFESAL